MNPIPFSEIDLYYQRFPTPHSLAVLLDIMRGLEADQMKQQAERIKKAQNQPAPEPAPSISR